MLWLTLAGDGTLEGRRQFLVSFSVDSTAWLFLLEIHFYSRSISAAGSYPFAWLI